MIVIIIFLSSQHFCNCIHLYWFALTFLRSIYINNLTILSNKMGNCDFKSDNADNKDPGKLKIDLGISKANFQMHYVLGKGGYGKVWKVKAKRENKEYALKEMSKAVIMAKKSITSINYEREILSRLRNSYKIINQRFICNMSFAFQDAENLYLIMDLCNGGDLRYHLYKSKRFNETETSIYHITF